ncbi:hypothetical protein ACXR0O_03845 [Verrucomicrobiota bacterium sgz303538]
MKSPSLLIVAGVAAMLLAPEARAQQSVQQLLTEAQQAYMRGDLETAKHQFQTVNRIDPKNPTAIGFLRRIQAENKAAANSSTVEKQLATVTIPKVEFRESTLGSALDYLKQILSKTTDGKTSVNFIVQLPEERVKSQTVTMSVTGMPFTEVLRYLGGLADVQFEYDRYAVVVKPKSAVSANTTTAPETTK